MKRELDLASEIVEAFSERRLPSNPSILPDYHSDYGSIRDFIDAVEMGLTLKRINSFSMTLMVVLSPRGYAYFFHLFMVLSLRHPTESRGNAYMHEFQHCLDGDHDTVGFKSLEACFDEFSANEAAVTAKWADWFISSGFLPIDETNYVETQRSLRIADNFRGLLRR